MGKCKLVQLEPDEEFNNLKKVYYSCGYVRKNQKKMLEEFCKRNRVQDKENDKSYIYFSQSLKDFLCNCKCNKKCYKKNNFCSYT